MNKPRFRLLLLWIAIFISYAQFVYAQSSNTTAPISILSEKVPLGTSSVPIRFEIGNFIFSKGNAKLTLTTSLIENEETSDLKNGFDLFFTFSSEKLTPDTTWDTAQFTIGKPALVIRDPASGKPGKTFAAVAEPFEKTFVFQNPERVAAEDRSKPAAASSSDLMKEFQASADNAQIQFSDIKIENDVLTYTLTSETDQDEFRFENTGLRSFSDSSVIGVKTYALVIQVDFILPDGTVLPISYDLFQDCGFEGERCDLGPQEF